jgi:plastocyanin
MMNCGWRRASALVGLFAFALVVSACGGDDDDATATTVTTAATTTSATSTSDLPKVTITATEYAFDVPAEVPAGYVEVTLVNNGKEGHHAQIVKLADGVTVDEFKAAASKTDIKSLSDDSFVGGPNGAGTVIAHLTPGNYVVVCFIPGDDGQPHVAKGMIKEFTVSGAEQGYKPAADETIKLTDFKFEPPASIPAGATVRVTNAGSQVHEIVLMKLDDGATLDDANPFILVPPGSPAPEGKPPFTEATGVVGLSTDKEAWIPNLKPGHYAAYCFFPNVNKDGGPPHVLDGMIGEFTVS